MAIDDDDIPTCYGDESEHDPENDRHCRVCDIRDACGAEVRAARKKRIRERASGSPSTSRIAAASGQSTLLARRRQRTAERDDAPRAELPVSRKDVSFWTALGHNTMLETLSAILKEFWYSVTQIPRYEYRSPWDDLDGDDPKSR